MAHTLLLNASMGSHRHRLPLLVLLVQVTLLHASGVASADDPDDPPPPAPYQGPPVYQGPPGPPVYVAPLSQQTQSTYVPQSVALSGPKQLPSYDDSRPPPAGYTAVFRKRKGLIIGGSITFGVPYMICLMTAAIGEDTSGEGRNEVASMWVPVAGPFIQMAETESATAKVFLAGLGGAQVAGAIMLYTGLTTEKRVFIRNDLIGSLTISPMASPGTSGMMVSGQF